MLAYFPATKDDKSRFLDLAIRQLKERLAVERGMQSELDQGHCGNSGSDAQVGFASCLVLKTMGLDGFPLCHSSQGGVQAAVNISSWQSRQIGRSSPNAPYGTCPPYSTAAQCCVKGDTTMPFAPRWASYVLPGDCLR